MSTAFDLLVIGDANPDVVLGGAPAALAFGQAEQLVDSAALVVGGSGAIMACGAARLGLRTAFAGVVGDDAGGRFMLDELHARDVDVSGCRVVGNVATGLTVHLVRGDDRSTLTSAGAIHVLEAGMVDEALATNARHVHVSAFFLQPGLAPGLRSLLDAARAAGASTSLDPNWDPSGRWDGGLKDVLAAVDLLFVNEEEAMAIAGVGDMGTAVTVLAAHGPQPVVKRGAAGALAYSGCRMIGASSLPVDVIDAVGAGDSFDAGYVYGHLQCWDASRSLAFGVTCGSLSTRAVGGTAAQPALADALAALDAAGITPRAAGDDSCAT